MENLDEALRNIDIFCRTLVKKMTEEDNEQNNNVTMEPMEKLLLRKQVIEEHAESNPLAKSMIPIPQAEEPLVDILEDDNYVKVLMQCRCREEKVTVHTDVNGLEVCKKECYTDAEGKEICTDKCQKLDLPAKHLRFENMISKCNNNTVLEIDIPKSNTT